MGHINEPLEVDFVVETTPLTEKEKKEIKEYINRYKARNTKRHSNLKIKRTKESLVQRSLVH